MTSEAFLYLTLVEYLPSQVDSLLPPPASRSTSSKIGCRIWETGWGSHQLLLDCQFDSFYAAIDPELVEDVRDMELDRAKADDEPFCNLVIVEAIDHAS